MYSLAVLLSLASPNKRSQVKLGGLLKGIDHSHFLSTMQYFILTSS
jgi:hypothetical protein